MRRQKVNKSGVALIALHDFGSFSIGIFHEILKNSGMDVNTIYFKSVNKNNTLTPPSDTEMNELMGLIKKLDPMLVGICVRSSLFKEACRITRDIKSMTGAFVVWGGIHPTIRPMQCLEFADAVCVGEGDEAIRELAVKLSKGEDVRGIKNLWLKDGGKVIKNDLRPLIQELDSVPFPGMTGENKFVIDQNTVSPVTRSEDVDAYQIMTSRGCPFSCAYCCNDTLKKLFKDKGKLVRRRSVDNVIAELKLARSAFKNLKYINFFDDVFTSDLDWITRFAGEYKREIGLPFYCSCHPKYVQEEIIKTLKDAGADFMSMGIQSGSEGIRKKYFQRYDTNEDIVKASHMLNKYKINGWYDIIIDSPLETEETMRETFDLLMRLARPFWTRMFTLTYFPETTLTKIVLEKGLISEDEIEDKKTLAFSRWSNTIDLERDDMNLFWNCLYYLAGRKEVPRPVVMRLSRSMFFRKHPKVLGILLRVIIAAYFIIKSDRKMHMIREILRKDSNFF
jgi:anaerobic magnesium-protoporphyrin IX monomethyl ester cyclase